MRPKQSRLKIGRKEKYIDIIRSNTSRAGVIVLKVEGFRAHTLPGFDPRHPLPSPSGSDP